MICLVLLLCRCLLAMGCKIRDVDIENEKGQGVILVGIGI